MSSTATQNSMMLRMKERVTISVEPEALEGVRAEVESGAAPNLSAAVEQSLLERKRSQGLRKAIELWEEEYGEIGEEAEEWARKEMERVERERMSWTQGR
jgi:Arc/MetJ-type ribon-helix-helix transcriptional regulator